MICACSLMDKAPAKNLSAHSLTDRVVVCGTTDPSSILGGRTKKIATNFFSVNSFLKYVVYPENFPQKIFRESGQDGNALVSKTNGSNP